MCLILFAYKSAPGYALILAANRDEFFNRPTEAATFWEGGEILAGKDLQAGGTWMGITRSKRIAAITNYRDPESIRPNKNSRGRIVIDFLEGNTAPEEYGFELKARSEEFSGYNLIFGTMEELYYFSNKTNELIRLTQGVYGLSNHLLDTPWHKVHYGKSFFTDIVNNGFEKERVFELLRNDIKPPDDDLPDTGVGIEIERIAAPIFIKTPYYGTRCSTLLSISDRGEAKFTERRFSPDSEEYEESAYELKLI